MNDFPIVHVLNGSGKLLDQSGGPSRVGQRTIESIVERTALDVLHDIKGQSVDLAKRI